MMYQVLLAFLTLLIEGFCEDPCPKYCSCSYTNSAIARCSILDANVQRFSSEISHLVMKDLKPDSSFYLRNNIFLDLGLEHVTSIEIINSSLKEIDVGAFHGLKILTDVDLSFNHLREILPNTFKNNTELRRLRLSNNPIQLRENNYFLDGPNIAELDLSSCDIVDLSQSTFLHLKNIETLILSHNKIKIIDGDMLKPMEFLDELNLSFNQITYIGPDTFADIEDMTVLNLKGNPLKSLSELYLLDLRELDVAEGQLRSLNPASLEGVLKVTFLNLSHNGIETVQQDVFTSLLDLTYLDMSHNNIRGPLPDDTFESNKKLEIISLSANPNLKILNGFRGYFPELYNFDISNCGLDQISNRTFIGMHFIATLNISNNNLHRLESNTFSGLKQLSVLDMSNNQLHFLPLKIFHSNSNIHKLYLGNNLFHHVPAALFLHTPKIYSLDIRNCRLNYLWNVSESAMMEKEQVLENLVYLNVAGNRLKKLHLQNVVSLRKLGKLDITDNPIECSNSFLHVIEWLMLHRVIPNRGMGNHPISITEEVNNNLQWDETIKSVCPMDRNVPTPSNTNGNKHIIHNDIINIDSEVLLKPNHLLGLKMATSESVAPSVDLEYERPEEGKFTWPLVFVGFSALCLIFALANIVFLMIYKWRRSYRLVSYKSHFPTPLGGFSHLRHKNAPIYQKLYEECSVPKTPIVKNVQGKNIISCITELEKAEAV